MEKIESFGFFKDLKKSRLNDWKKLYEYWLTFDETDTNLSTNKKYTEEELERIHDIARQNLEQIKRVENEQE
jgi:hypothetical protein